MQVSFIDVSWYLELTICGKPVLVKMLWIRIASQSTWRSSSTLHNRRHTIGFKVVEWLTELSALSSISKKIEHIFNAMRGLFRQLNGYYGLREKEQYMNLGYSLGAGLHNITHNLQ